MGTREGVEKLVNYYAERPGVEKLSKHGLFSQTDEKINLDEVADEVSNHNGIVWTHVISLKREDAERLGYNNANAWKSLVRRNVLEIAKAHKIEPSDLQWYGAFHNTTHHPHIHLLVYSKSGQGYLTNNGIESMRSAFGNDIFKNEQYKLFEMLTEIRDELKNVTVEQALNHPNWSMGAKITIDSASMMNKGLEIIEASRLFDVEGDRIDVVVHRESIIHSLVEYDDNSVIAQLGLPDMRIPIQYAVTYPDRYESPVGELKLADIAKMTFFEPDYKTFECLTACKKALDTGGTATAVVNGANEEANALFRQGKISFLEIGSLVTESLNAVKTINQKNVEDVLNADALAREFVRRTVNK